MSLDNSAVVPALPTGGYTIDQSLRFNDGDSAYLYRTPSSAGNRQTWTWSGWVKRGNVGLQNHFFSSGTGSSPMFLSFGFNSSDYLECLSFDYNFFGTTQKFRDVSSWYHIVIVLDSSNSTADDRMRVYVNGSRVTDFWQDQANLITQNQEFAINYTSQHEIGRSSYYSSKYFDGYLAEVNFIDGQALDASYFGETDSTYGHWKPKAYSGSYGTNGFYLDFDGTYYNDKSGNGNNFTANNLASTDVVLDSPTNNFCVMNPLDVNSGEPPESFSQGNLRVDTPGADNGFATGTMGMSSGKWYWELYMEGHDGLSLAKAGISGDCQPSGGEIGGTACEYVYESYNGNKVNNGSGTSYGSTWTTGDIIGFAYDADNGNLTFYKNGTSQGTAFTGITGDMRPAMSDASGTAYGVILGYNFGQDSSFYGQVTAQGNTDDNGIGDFYYTPPSGYLALCTANLPDPAVIPSEHFNTVVWASESPYGDISITGVGFQPDLVWAKSRTDAYSHVLTDSIRGVGKSLYSDTTWAETTNDVGGYLGSFDADGFTGTEGSTDNSYFNYGSGDSYVAWNWKANGSGVSNTNGSITSTVSANEDAGFSIVSYAGNDTASATVGHGLSQAPEIVIVKNRTESTPNWETFVKNITGISDGKLRLNTSDALNTTYPLGTTNSTIFTLPNVNSDAWSFSGDNFIAYCFHSVDGFSKVGKYDGNGSTDGTFVYTGFRPAFVIVKCINQAGHNWQIADNRRYEYNVEYHRLLADSSASEYTNFNMFDFTSNGFKLRNSEDWLNYSGNSYLYIAFAENPFKYTNAR